MAVGLVYDPIYLEHHTGEHPENATRLVETVCLMESTGLQQRLVEIRPRPASVEELSLVHSQDHIAHIESAAASGVGWLDADTVVSPASYRVALNAAGGAIEAAEAVMTGRVDSAFALVSGCANTRNGQCHSCGSRSPGELVGERRTGPGRRHASLDSRLRGNDPTEAMGFCLFNNVAIAAKQMLRSHQLERVLIVDFDVHHGNGTQDVFYSDPKVLYFSTHQYPHYPGSGAVDDVGAGKGEGTTINVPLPAWCGDREYANVFQDILVPAARRFQPQLILVSAGYDAHWADTLSSMQLSISGFAGMARTLREMASELCHGRLVFVLEGGYHITALAYSVQATIETLLGMVDTADPLGQSTCTRKPSGFEAIVRRVKAVHRL
ncbi:MAG: histone deacetylase [Chloroflexi bacterium]|nr:histone deacetylase [Chloroflexota bacterium]